MNKYIAHSANRKGEEQSMKQHSEGVASLMKSFALTNDFAEIYSAEYIRTKHEKNQKRRK